MSHRLEQDEACVKSLTGRAPANAALPCPGSFSLNMRQFVKRALERAGYQLMGNEEPIYANKTATERSMQLVSANTMLSRARLVSLADQVSYCIRSGIEGDFVECGVWKGGGIGMVAATLLSEGVSNRHLHLLDSFTDICAPDPAIDGERAAAEIVGPVQQADAAPQPMVGAYDAVGGHGTVAACRELIEGKIGYPASFVHYHEGWFQDTLPAVSAGISKIALLRLDGDWYASTKICLEYLFEKVVSGGFVIVDDYGAYEGCRRAVDEFLAASGQPPFLFRTDNVCYCFIKQ